MQRRTTVNVVAGSTATFSLIGWLGPEILQAAHLLDNAEALRSMMALAQEVKLSWEGIYLFGFILSVGTLIGVNFDLLRSWNETRAERNKRAWNVTAIEAIRYIIDDSYFGTSFLTNKRECKAINAFTDTARSGKLKISGVMAGKSLLAEVPKSAWIRLYFKIEPVYGEDRAALYKSNRNADPEISNLMVDRNELQRLWPPKPPSYR